MRFIPPLRHDNANWWDEVHPTLRANRETCWRQEALRPLHGYERFDAVK